MPTITSLLRQIGRAVVVASARMVFGKPATREIGARAKILVIRTDERVGNVLLTIPLLRALRHGLPTATIVFLHAASKGSLIDGLRYFDQRVPFERKHFFTRPWSFAAMLFRLRRERFDVVIEAGHYHAFSLTAALLARAISGTSAAIIGHDRGHARTFFTHPVIAPENVVQDVEVKLSLLGPVGLGAQGMWLETPLGGDDASLHAADALLSAAGLSRARLLLVNPGARKVDRRWPAVRYGLAARRIAEAQGLSALVLWGPGEEDMAREVVSAAGSHATLAPRTDLRLLAALFRRASLVLTNDTGPMHLAVAVGAPTVAVFTVADHERWGHAVPHFAAVRIDAFSESQESEVEAVVEASVRVTNAVPPLKHPLPSGACAC